MTERMLRCRDCEKPVLLMTPEQAARAAAQPEAYLFACLDCAGDRSAWTDTYREAGG